MAADPEQSEDIARDRTAAAAVQLTCGEQSSAESATLDSLPSEEVRTHSAVLVWMFRTPADDCLPSRRSGRKPRSTMMSLGGPKLSSRSRPHRTNMVNRKRSLLRLATWRAARTPHDPRPSVARSWHLSAWTGGLLHQACSRLLSTGDARHPFLFAKAVAIARKSGPARTPIGDLPMA
jgi:hypothetical protein